MLKHILKKFIKDRSLLIGFYLVNMACMITFFHLSEPANTEFFYPLSIGLFLLTIYLVIDFFHYHQTNLDSKSSAVIMECFEKIVHELSTTVLLVTHDIFAASYCRKVIFIKDGHIYSYIVKKGSRKEFFNQIMDNLAVLGGRTHVF